MSASRKFATVGSIQAINQSSIKLPSSAWDNNSRQTYASNVSAITIASGSSNSNQNGYYSHNEDTATDQVDREVYLENLKTELEQNLSDIIYQEIGELKTYLENSLNQLEYKLDQFDSQANVESNLYMYENLESGVVVEELNPAINKLPRPKAKSINKQPSIDIEENAVLSDSNKENILTSASCNAESVNVEQEISTGSIANAQHSATSATTPHEVQPTAEQVEIRSDSKGNKVYSQVFSKEFDESFSSDDEPENHPKSAALSLPMTTSVTPVMMASVQDIKEDTCVNAYSRVAATNPESSSVNSVDSASTSSDTVQVLSTKNINPVILPLSITSQTPPTATVATTSHVISPVGQISNSTVNAQQQINSIAIQSTSTASPSSQTIDSRSTSNKYVAPATALLKQSPQNNRLRIIPVMHVNPTVADVTPTNTSDEFTSIENILEGLRNNDVTAIIDVLKLVDLSCTYVIERACWAIMNLAGKSADNKQQLGEIGACPLMVAILSSYGTSHPSLTDQLCGAIINMMTQDNGNSVRFNEHNIAEPLIASLCAFGLTFPNLSKKISWIICLLTSTNSNNSCEKFGNLGANECLVSLLKKYCPNSSSNVDNSEVGPSTNQLPQLSENANISEKILLSILYLTIHDAENRKRIGSVYESCHVINRVIVNALVNNNTNLVELGCKVVASICTSNSEHAINFGIAGTCETLVNILEHSTTFGNQKYSVIDNALKAMLHMTTNNPMNKQKFSTANCCAIMLGSLRDILYQPIVNETTSTDESTIAVILPTETQKDSSIMIDNNELKSSIAASGKSQSNCNDTGRDTIWDIGSGRDTVWDASGVGSVDGTPKQSIRKKVVAATNENSANGDDSLLSELPKECSNQTRKQLVVSAADSYKSINTISFDESTGKFVASEPEDTTIVFSVKAPPDGRLMKQRQENLIELFCRALAALSVSHSENTKRLGTEGVGMDIVFILSKYCKDYEGNNITESVFSLITNIAATDLTIKRQFASAEIGEMVIEILESLNANRSNIIEKGLRALLSLISNNPDYKSALGAKRSCEIILLILFSIEVAHVNVIEFGFRALFNLSANYPDNIRRCVDYGACEIVISVSSAVGLSHPNAAEQGCRLIQALASNSPENKLKLCNAGAGEMLVKILNQIDSSIALLSVAEQCLERSYELEACAAVLSLATSVETIFKLGNANACSAITNVLSQLGFIYPQVAEKGIKALVNLSSNNSDNKKRLVEANINKVLAVIMNGPGATNTTIAENTCRVITNLSSNSRENQNILSEAGLCEIIIRALRNNGTTNPTFAEQACRAVINMASDNPTNMEKFGDADGCETLVYILTNLTNTNNVSIIEKACWAIFLLISTNIDNRQKFIEAGIIPILTQISYHDNYTSVTKSCSVEALKILNLNR